ncbi:MAG TPA: AAA family ATPase [Caulobacteraceae bacterium]|jgi:hypothetical protein
MAEPDTYVSEARIRLIPFGAIKLGTQRRDLVRGLIPRVGLVVVWGAPKSGKSFWVFDLVMHVALGREYRQGGRTLRRVGGHPTAVGANNLPRRPPTFEEPPAAISDKPL